MDRRKIRHRISRLRGEIEDIRKHRQLHRERRRRERLPLVSLVGYTNAGKSTLFRALSGEATLVSSRLFSTLDTLIRRIRLAGDRAILISDTVGFIRKLPHQLVTAFRATLEEVVEADLVLHVVDVSDPERLEKRDTVLGVLAGIGADGAGQRRLTVYNKLDLLKADDPVPLLQAGEFLVSAVTRRGLPELVEAIGDALRERAGDRSSADGPGLY
jgi:GTP-binding protein HflX